jgi:hypothetical protein
MPARKKIDLEKVMASLSKPCPHCGHEITLAQLLRIDYEALQEPWLGLLALVSGFLAVKHY